MSIECENALPVGSRLNGTQADQYEILSVLGAGGFGITYKARDHLLQSDVAIKEYLPLDLALRKKDGATVVPRTSTQSQDYEWGLERFLDEARTLSRFKTEPNIVRVESFLPANGTAYMVMQYEAGESLEEYLKRQGVLDEEQLRSILFPILDGLRAIHAEGFLHRDIKPANIYLRKNGTPILLDFGAARQALGDHSHSITGILTAGFAPFEQYSTRSNLTAAADIYSLGATLYKCITNQTPVEATERISAMHNEEPDPLAAIEELVSKQYSTQTYKGLAWMLEPLAKDRPQSVEEVLEVFIDLADISSNKEGEEKLSESVPGNRGHEFDNFSLAGETKKPAVILLSENRKTIVIVGSVLSVLIIMGVLFFGGLFGEKNQINNYVLAKKLYYKGQYDLSRPLFEKLANKKHALSEYYLSEIERVSSSKNKDLKKQKYWVKRAISHGLIAELKDKARANIAGYQSILGLMYFRGDGVTKDNRLSINWFKKAANNGNARGINNLGVMYYQGIGVTKNYPKAFSLFKRSAAQGNASAHTNLGKMYKLGLAVAKDNKQALALFHKSAERGNIDAYFQLGVMHQLGLGTSKDYKQAVKWFQKSAETGHSLAQASLGKMYRLGLGVVKDYTTAIKWFKKSASQGDRSGQYNIGYMYFKGYGVPKDYAQAISWYRKSAVQGYSAAQVNLGFMYGQGFGITKNYVRAVAWYRKSAAQGHMMGQYNLGVMYSRGYGVKRDYFEAFKWYKKAAILGNVLAQNKLGAMHEQGQGTGKNFNLAIKWYRMSANRSNSTGQYNLGSMYHRGLGVVKNYRQAMSWYRLADAQGLNFAQRAIGLMYEKGQGVVTNIKTARTWYNKALANGSKRAAIDLRRINRTSTPTNNPLPGGRRGLFDGI